MSDRLKEAPEHAAALRRRAADAAQREADADAPQPHPLVTLGGQVGNAQVERMLAQREGEEEEEVQAQHDLRREGEEDEEEVQAQHDLQREGEEDEEEVQAQHDAGAEHAPSGEAAPEVGLEGGPISASLSGRIDSRRGGGAPLDAGSRASMEGAFGTSFDDVRLHTDAESDALNRSISAKAFTTGSDIFFRQDASPSDQGLLAHELTHVVQQRGSSGGGGTMRVGPAGDSSEQAADATSSAVTSGAAAQAQREADEAAAATVARQDGELEEEEQG